MSKGITKQDLVELKEGITRSIHARIDGLEVRIDATRQDLVGLKDTLAGRFTTIDQRFDGLEARMTANTQDIISHFNHSQGFQNQRMDVMDAKLDALLEGASTRREMHNLVGALHKHGIPLKDNEIFV